MCLYNADPTGKQDQFLGEGLIDLYSKVPFDEDSGNVKARNYEDWIKLVGGPADNEGVVRVKLSVAEKLAPVLEEQAASYAAEDGVEEGASSKVSTAATTPEAIVDHAAESEQTDRQRKRAEKKNKRREERPSEDLGVDPHPDKATYSMANVKINPGRRRDSGHPDGAEINVEARRLTGLSSSGAKGYRKHSSSLFHPMSFRFQIFEARDLMARDPDIAATHGPFPTSYCFIEWRHDQICATSAVKHTLNPKWSNEKFVLGVDVSSTSNSANIRVTVISGFRCLL